MENLTLDTKVQLKVRLSTYPTGMMESFKTKGTLRECLAEVADFDSFYIQGDEIRRGVDDDGEILTLDSILDRLDNCDGAAYIFELEVRVGNGKYECLIANSDFDDF